MRLSKEPSTRREQSVCSVCRRRVIQYSVCRCKENYSHNIHGICEQCGENEVRNDETKMCECYSDYARNKSGNCIYCSFENHKKHYTPHNDTICSCRHGFLLNASGDCVRVSHRFGFVFCSIGFAIFSILGLVCGYVLRQCSDKSDQPSPVNV